jgi:hypothetical protein
MRRVLAPLLLLLAASPALAGYGRVYLVPALVACPGPATCERAYASRYTFDSIVLRTPSSKYMPADKPALLVEFRGVRDPAGVPLSGEVTVRVLSGRTSIPGFGTLPDGSPLSQVPPIKVTLVKGKGKVAYRPPATPNGLVTNGGGVEVLDPVGNLLAVTGSQSRP